MRWGAPGQTGQGGQGEALGRLLFQAAGAVRAETAVQQPAAHARPLLPRAALTLLLQGEDTSSALMPQITLTAWLSSPRPCFCADGLRCVCGRARTYLLV